ncbi:hypothetical protein YC2023_041473 [Brassica napus]
MESCVDVPIDWHEVPEFESGITEDEAPVKKKEKFLKRIMHCGICGEANHNSSFHKKNPKRPFLSDDSSQPESSQGVCTQNTQPKK